jgi:ABC-type lipoprotein export system ATPase subunit
MNISQQRIHSLKFNQLKNLKDVEISFEPFPLTAIFGVNGSGKSSILYALLCLYRREKKADQNFKFSQFFIHTPHSKYEGSSLELLHSYPQGKEEYSEIKRNYYKDSRWNPRYNNRPIRPIYFIGINSCVPEIEKFKSQSLVHFQTKNLTDQSSDEIRKIASFILNTEYVELNAHKVTKSHKTLVGVQRNDVSYSSLAMGSGEQRLFNILQVVSKAEKYALIVIDEIDLTLHTEALNRLIDWLQKSAIEKTLQIVFSSHRENLAERTDINIRHIYQNEHKTICLEYTHPDSLRRLTGKQTALFEIYVEDELAELIVSRILEQKNIRRFCAIIKYGSINNAFTLLAGLKLKGENTKDKLVILDGDLYRTSEEQKIQIKKHLTGTEPSNEEKIVDSLNCIRQFVIEEEYSPEQFLHFTLRRINDGSEIVEAAKSILLVINKHDYINQIFTQLGHTNKTLGLKSIVDKFSESEIWHSYTKEVLDWLDQKIKEKKLT